MLAEQRYQKIISLMQTDGSVKVADLKKKMGVSPETVRRDLENMESQGLIRRTRGGAFLADKEDLSGRGPSNIRIFQPGKERIWKTRWRLQSLRSASLKKASP